MREYQRRVWLGAVAVLSLLAGVLAPASVLADDARTVGVSVPAPDLIVEAITWSPEVPSMGDKVTFTVTVGNQGSGPASSSHVAYYIDDTYQASTSVDSIDPGATAMKTFTWTAAAGSHIIKAVADSNKSVTESDETNNNITFAFSVLAPDLVIEAITWSPEEPSVGDQVDFAVTIKNQGSEQARYSRVELCIDGYSRGYKEVPRTEAGANMTATFPWTAQVGSHTVEAIADVLNQVKESDKTNNSKVVTYATAAPDLIINAITWSPENPSENATVTFTVTIKNQGSGKATPSYLACYIDDVCQDSVYISQIAANTTVTKTFTWLTKADSRNFKAVADNNNSVVESDETNNAQTVALPTVAPDLIIQSINWSPSSLAISHRATFVLNIKNQGKTAACDSILYVGIDDYYEYEWQLKVPEIAAGANITRSLAWTVKKDSHVIKAIADVDNCIIESDESNNVKTITVSVSSPSPPDLVVQDIAWSPENPSIGDEVTFTVSIKNQGSGQARPSHVAYYIDDTLMTSDYVEQTDAGATDTQTFTWNAQAGSHTVKAVVDCNESVSESNETNNEKSVAMTTPSPDLVVQGINWSPVSPSAGDIVTFTVTVKNQGIAEASRSCVAYSIDGSSRGYHNIQEIDAGDSLTTTFTWTAPAGSHVISIMADKENQVPESDESNNERVVNLPAPDLVIEDITWSPANPSENTTVTFKVTTGNQGRGSADTSCVHLYIDGSSEGYESVGEIGTGATVTRTFAWKAQAGSHTVRAVADGENQVTEIDEANNESSINLLVLVSPSAASATVSEPAPIITTGLEEGVHLQALSTYVAPGENIVLNLRAVNPATNPIMTVEMVIQVPSGMSIASSEFVKDDKGRYGASYTVEPGDTQKIEVCIKAHEEGSFNILSDISYYLAEDKAAAEHKIMTLPVTVGNDEASAEKSLLNDLPGQEFWRNWWFISAVVVLVGVVIIAVLRSRRRSPA